MLHCHRIKNRRERVYKHGRKLAKFEKFEKYWVWVLPSKKYFNVNVLNIFTIFNKHFLLIFLIFFGQRYHTFPFFTIFVIFVMSVFFKYILFYFMCVKNKRLPADVILQLVNGKTFREKTTFFLNFFQKYFPCFNFISNQSSK